MESASNLPAGSSGPTTGRPPPSLKRSSASRAPDVEARAARAPHRLEPAAAAHVRRMVALWWGAVVSSRSRRTCCRARRRVRADRKRRRHPVDAFATVTLIEILLGFGLTIVTAIPLGPADRAVALAKQVVYPPIMLMQLVPKIAVAPLFLVWLGFGIESKVLLTVLMTFFPLLLASISGFMILDDRLLFLTQSMGASRWDTFRYLRFPRRCP
jgi:ABC-type nitrate/sulfonate/bicarbonate transport system permease component